MIGRRAGGSDLGSEVGLDVHVREDDVVRRIGQARCHALGAVVVPLDPQRVVGDSDMHVLALPAVISPKSRG